VRDIHALLPIDPVTRRNIANRPLRDGAVDYRFFLLAGTAAEAVARAPPSGWIVTRLRCAGRPSQMISSLPWLVAIRASDSLTICGPLIAPEKTRKWSAKDACRTLADVCHADDPGLADTEFRMVRFFLAV